MKLYLDDPHNGGDCLESAWEVYVMILFCMNREVAWGCAKLPKRRRVNCLRVEKHNVIVIGPIGFEKIGQNHLWIASEDCLKVVARFTM